MATAVKKLDLRAGELIEIDGRRYEVVSDREGGLILEPAITPMAELHAMRGTRPASDEDFDRLFGHLPTDGEGRWRGAIRASGGRVSRRRRGARSA